MLPERAVTKKWLKSRLALEEAVSRISRMLLASDTTDLKDVLKLTGEAVAADRVSLIAYNMESVGYGHTCEWVKSDKIEISRNNKQTLKFLQWIHSSLKRKSILMIPDMNIQQFEDFPAKEIQDSDQFRSLLAIPINSNGHGLTGSITFETFSETREWLGEEVQTFRIISEMISAYWERKNAVSALETSEKKYRELYIRSKKTEERYLSLLNSSADAIVISDLKGMTKYVNPSFVTLFGWAIDDIREQRIPFIPGRNILSYEKLFKEVAEKGKALHAFETERYTKSGEILNVSLSISRFDDHNGTPSGILYVLRDISEKKELEAQLLQAQKMEAIGILTGGIAHDFNNNLQAIFGCTEILLMDKDYDHPDYSKLMTIEKSIQRASDLTRRLLMFGKKMENEFEPTDLNNEVVQINEILERTIPKMISIELLIDSSINLIKADSGQLEQIIMNIAINARDAMPEGGNLLFRTDQVILNHDFCSVNPGSKPGEYVRLTISDNGNGMDEHTLKHIYEPFFSTKKAGEGTGLGMAMVYGIVKAHDGYIRCSSKKGEGTSFEIYFPVLNEGTTRMDTHEQVPGLKGNNEIILFVEDDDINREIGKELLTQFGYNVVVAQDCESALGYFMNNREEIDLVISDLIMPGIGGEKLLKKILDIDPEARVIIASGYNTSDSARKVRECGAKDFISKPYEMNRMLSVVRNVLNE